MTGLSERRPRATESRMSVTVCTHCLTRTSRLTIPLPPFYKRTSMLINFRVSSAEKQLLVSQASRSGISLSQLIRRQLFGAPLPLGVPSTNADPGSPVGTVGENELHSGMADGTNLDSSIPPASSSKTVPPPPELCPRCASKGKPDCWLCLFNQQAYETSLHALAASTSSPLSV